MSDRRRYLAAIGIMSLFLIPMLAFLVARHEPPGDLAVYQLAGRMFATGGGLYNEGWGTSLASPLPYTYPPLWAAVVVPLAWLPWRVATSFWTLVNLGLLAWIVDLSYARLIRRFDSRRAIIVATLTVAAAVMAPPTDTFLLGQVGILLTAACLADTVPERTRLPRGILVGFSTAVKLTPGIFIPYWAVTRRWRPALTAAAVAVCLWLLAALARPELSRQFWTDQVFRNDRVGDASIAIDQSLRGLLLRTGWDNAAVWALLAVGIIVVGFRRAARAHVHGDELAAVTLVGLTGLLVSPVSWIHHAIWIVPATGVLLGSGRTRAQWGRWGVVFALFLLRTPQWVEAGWLPAGPILTPILENAYVWAYLALVLFLPNDDEAREPVYPSVASVPT